MSRESVLMQVAMSQESVPAGGGNLVRISAYAGGTISQSRLAVTL